MENIKRLKFLTKPDSKHCLAKFVGYSSNDSLRQAISQLNRDGSRSGDAKELLLTLGFKEFSKMTDDEVLEYVENNREVKKIATYKDGEQIDVYQDLSQAVELSGVSKQMITNCLTGKQHYNTAGGLQWKYL